MTERSLVAIVTGMYREWSDLVARTEPCRGSEGGYIFMFFGVFIACARNASHPM